MSDTIREQHQPDPRDFCRIDGQRMPCDARQEGNRADANADLAEAAQDEVRMLTLRADAAERERDALRAAALEVLRATWRTDENIGALQELDQVLAAGPDTGPDTGPETEEGRYIERMRSLNHDGCNHADDQWNCR